MRTRIYIAILLSFFTVFSVSCEPDTPAPEQVTNAFMTAISNQNWEVAKNFLHPDCQPILDSVLKSSYPRLSMGFTQLEKLDSKSGVMVRVLIGGGSVAKKIPLKKVSGHWKIDCRDKLLEGENGIIESMFPGIRIPPPKEIVRPEKIAAQFLDAILSNDSALALAVTDSGSMGIATHFLQSAERKKMKKTFVTGSRFVGNQAVAFFIFEGEPNTHLVNLNLVDDNWKVACTEKTFTGRDKSLLPDYENIEFVWSGEYVCPNGCAKAVHTGNCPTCGKELQKEMVRKDKKQD